jgi:hypothetical protein
MTNDEFKKHLKDLAHGHHHPEEHDWGPGGVTGKPPAKARSAAGRKPAVKKRTSKSK